MVNDPLDLETYYSALMLLIQWYVSNHRHRFFNLLLTLQMIVQGFYLVLIIVLISQLWRWIVSSSLVDLNECLMFGVCSHHCVNTQGSYKCVCDQNFQEKNNSCIAKGKVTKKPFQFCHEYLMGKILYIAF